MHRTTLRVSTRGRSTVSLTSDLRAAVRASGVRDGLLNAFIQHTSASLIINENADPTVRDDLERFMSNLVVDGDPLYRHDAEGPDDMPAHIRSVLTATSLVLPVQDGELAVGTWQGVYLWEHRAHPHERRVLVTVW